MATKTLIKYIPVATDDLEVDTILDFDIFIQTSDNIVLFRKQNLPFTEGTLHNLSENKVKTIFISEEDREKLDNYYHSRKAITVQKCQANALLHHLIIRKM